MTRVRTPHGGLEVSMAGPGRDAVLLLGDLLLSEAALYERLIQQLERRYRCIWYAPRGLGAPCDPEEGESEPAMGVWVEDAVEVLRKLGPRAHLVGLGLGAHVALRAAAAHPQRVRTVTAISPGPARPSRKEIALYRPLTRVGRLTGARPWMRRLMAHLFGLPFLRDPTREQERQHWPARIAHRAWRAAAAIQAALQRRPMVGLLARVRAPTLLLHGEEDQLSSLADSHQLAATLSRAELAPLPHAGHAATIEEPEAVWAHLQPFLERSWPQDQPSAASRSA